MRRARRDPRFLTVPRRRARRMAGRTVARTPMRAAGGELASAPARELTDDPDSEADGRPDMTDQTGSWLDVLNLVGLQSVLDGRSLAPDNNLLLPAQPGSAPTDGMLVQRDARPATSGPARVGVILGPEGTLRG